MFHIIWFDLTYQFIHKTEFVEGCRFRNIRSRTLLRRPRIEKDALAVVLLETASSCLLAFVSRREGGDKERDEKSEKRGRLAALASRTSSVRALQHFVVGRREDEGRRMGLRNFVEGRRISVSSVIQVTVLTVNFATTDDLEQHTSATLLELNCTQFSVAAF
ncbi:hypothetical protein R1sor_006325 [Riccia sorocarpa]|uniref:Uncharacterized protein n=1 Tax=Riccia sorocarpa TaxID=122646 RepID=A0ABD3HTJ7_9MARC